MKTIVSKDEDAFMEIAGDKAVIASTAIFFQQLALNKGMETSQAFRLRFALEDLFNFIFSFLIIQKEDTNRIRIRSSFDENALCLVIHECGIPILAEEIPDITVEDLFNKDFQPPTLIDQPESIYHGFGIHLIKKMIDEFSISHYDKHKYYEIRIKQNFSIQPTKKLPPALPETTKYSSLAFPLDEDKVDLGDNYVLKRLNSSKEAVQVVRGFIETYGYSLCEYNSITGVNDYLSIINMGTYFPYIVTGTDNRVIHHFAFHQCSYNPHYIEHCHMFTRSFYRGKINSINIIHTANRLPLVQKYEGLYAFSVSMHFVSQLGALRNGYHITGFHFDKLHVKLRSAHIDSPDFFCLVEMHKTIHPRTRELYVPQKYQDTVQSIYTDLQLPVIFKETDGKIIKSVETSQIIVEKDESFCRSLILLHPHAADWNVISKEVAKARIKGVPVLRISVSADEPDCIGLANLMEELDFIFTGITPINNLLVFHYFNGIEIDFNQIQLVHDFGRPLLKSIETEYNRIFPL